MEQAWAAGFFDGEGSFVLSRTGGQRRPRDHRLVLAVAQKDRRPLERFRAAVGGGGHLSRNGKGYWQFTLTNRQAVAAFEVLRPYLSPPKLEQAAATLAAHTEYSKLAHERIVNGWRSRKDLNLGRRVA